jgi:hypothetical protein
VYGGVALLGDESEERRKTCVSASADFREHSEFRDVEVQNQNLESPTIYILVQLAYAPIPRNVLFLLHLLRESYGLISFEVPIHGMFIDSFG